MEILVCDFDLSHPISEQVIQHLVACWSMTTTTVKAQKGYVRKEDIAPFQDLHVPFCFLKIKNINNFAFIFSSVKMLKHWTRCSQGEV